jgi:small subunit ribosomal protein S6
MDPVEYRSGLSGLGRWEEEAIVDRGLTTHRKEVSRLRDYEILYIVRADLDDEKVQDAVKRVNTLIERVGGTPERTNLWGKRRLAYEVKHQREGSYILQDFNLDPDRVPELEAGLKISEEVLRHLIVRKPEKAVATAATAPPAGVATGSESESAQAATPRRQDREVREEA